ncbi:MAG: helix-turn-helix transcriptional regulator [Treponema sp.]|jgi:transcriptional regulator with XRE-family HTH domain|nr:helix-turn-helix transcriptional regulator [Treponema sp.]
MSVSTRIREVRKTLSLSQKDFAKTICVSGSYLADVENDYRKVNDRLIRLVSVIHGINEQWLKTGEGEMFYKAPDEKMARVISIFNKLPADFQDYALEQLENLLKLRQKQGKV